MKYKSGMNQAGSNNYGKGFKLIDIDIKGLKRNLELVEEDYKENDTTEHAGSP